MLGNLLTLNLLSTVAIAVTGIMIDKSFYLFFVSISICQACNGRQKKKKKNIYIYIYICSLVVILVEVLVVIF